MTKITPLILPVTRYPWMILGKYHICIGAPGTGTRPILITIYRIVGITIEFRHKGIIKIGFHTTGAPKTIGSFMLNMAGKMQTFPIAYNLFTLDLMHMITSAIVHP